MYLLLILLAMQFVSIYLLQSLERYYLNNFSASLSSQGQLVATFLQRYMGGPDVDELARLTQEFAREARVEMAVVDRGGGVICASSARQERFPTLLDQATAARALSGSLSSTVRIDPDSGDRTLHLAVPISGDGSTPLGAVYLVASLEDTYATLHDIRKILLTATLLALGITAVVGFALARTITQPIRAITSRAARMASGDFDQYIEVRSGDEIGQLAKAFNYLTERLRDTLGEISGEKAKVEAIIRHMADGLVAVDRTGRIIVINRAAARMLGVTGREVLGQPAQAVFGELLPQALLRQCIQGSRQLSQELRLERSGRLLRAQVAPFRSARGRVTGAVVVLQDITEHHRLEQMRREFLANVSHELRTPLTTVKSYVETLLDGAMEDPILGRRFLEVVQRETDRMARLVNDLLQLSQMEYLRQRWKRQPLNIEDVIADVVERLRLEASSKGLSLRVDSEPELPQVLGDAEQLGQVLANLLSNAIKFTPPGGSVAVTAQRHPRGVAVTVRDTGIGIPREDLPRVFDRFYRVEKARSREMGGTGLGLSIAREIVEAHDGSIEIESEPGRGTRVTLVVPMVQEGRS